MAGIKPLIYRSRFNLLLIERSVTSYYYYCMKQSLLAVILFLLIIPACRKNNKGANEVISSWKLIQVYDKNTAAYISPPAGSDIYVSITFLTGNRFVGHTQRNQITDGTYSQTGNEITFGPFAMTKVAEDEWGGSFLTVLTSCLLQSSFPCKSSTITIQGNIMKIVTPFLRYDITLEKL